ncbi:hypothetical protein DFQ26_000446 [Actinomortierella ambigua]|nr:hypothetical protein DFQ26_000446 [Actinomortierella ambigua]
MHTPIVVPDSVSIRLRSITCKGAHEKTEVSLKLQGVTQWSKPYKNLGDHTCETFEFQTSIHIMSFDSIKIDLYDVNVLGAHTRIGRAYLPLRDMVKKVAHRIDSAVDKTLQRSPLLKATSFTSTMSSLSSSSSSTGPLPSPTSPTSPNTDQRGTGTGDPPPHRDVVQVDLPLFKHGSYSKFGISDHSFHHMGSIFASHPDDAKKPKEVLISTGSQPGTKDVAKTIVPPPMKRLDSYAETVMNGVKVGMLTVEVGLNYKDLKRRNTYYTTRLRSKSMDASSPPGIHRGGSSATGSSPVDPTSVGVSGEATGTNSGRPRRMRRSNTNQTVTTWASIATVTTTTTTTDGTTNGTTHFVADSAALTKSYAELRSSKKIPNPLTIQIKGEDTSGNSNSSEAIELPPATPKSISDPGSPTSPIQPCLHTFQSKRSLVDSSDEGSELDQMFTSDPVCEYSDDDEDGSMENANDREKEGKELETGSDRFDDENLYLDGQSHLRDEYKGENMTHADLEREEHLMARIVANGDPVKQKEYLEGHHHHQHEGKQPHDSKECPQQPGHGGKGKKFKFQLFSDETRSAFKDIQLLYSSFFGHGWNLTRGDFWKGIHLVEKYYEKHPMQITNRAFDDIETLERARHFIRLAIATYGSLPWLYFGYSYKSTALNFVRLNSDRKNVIDYFKLNKEDMITWHFDKRSALIPSYYIIRDPHTNSLCVIIRGTFSITDAMTDLVCEYYPYKGGLVHKGIMDNARFVFERSGKDIETALRKFNLDKLYCIGHSLGAGSASLLCSLLQDHLRDFIIPADRSSTGKARRLEVKAYLFAPPPIATLDLARSWEKTQLTIVNENDIVSRLSYGNALDLKEMIKIGAYESRNPAYKGLSRHEKEERVLAVLHRAQEKLRAVDDIPRLVLPGKVAYLHKVYRSTPVVRSQDSNDSNRFDSAGGSSNSNTPTPADKPVAKSWAKSLNTFGTALQLKNLTKASSSSSSSTTATATAAATTATADDSGNNNNDNNNNERSGHVLEGDTSVKTPLESLSTSEDATLGTPVKYTQTSHERAQTTESILQQSHEGLSSAVSSDSNNSSSSSDSRGSGSRENSPLSTSETEESEAAAATILTTKPKKDKHYLARKEMRIEYSDRERFMAIPLRSNWAWHHFPQQYDSRIERALAWAKAQMATEEDKRNGGASR